MDGYLHHDWMEEVDCAAVVVNDVMLVAGGQ